MAAVCIWGGSGSEGESQRAQRVCRLGGIELPVQRIGWRCHITLSNEIITLTKNQLGGEESNGLWPIG